MSRTKVTFNVEDPVMESNLGRVGLSYTQSRVDPMVFIG